MKKSRKKIQDVYFLKAKQEGFAARSAYKLQEIDRKRALLRRGMRVLDLGASPGSWLQYAAKAVGQEGEVVGADLKPLHIALPPNVATIVVDVFESSPEALLLGRRRFDVILSDLAPATIGVPSADAARSADLALRALELAQDLLAPGGAMLAKIFQGARLAEVRGAFSGAFTKVTLEKPKASRAESVEIFLLGTGARILPDSSTPPSA